MVHRSKILIISVIIIFSLLVACSPSEQSLPTLMSTSEPLPTNIPATQTTVSATDAPTSVPTDTPSPVPATETPILSETPLPLATSFPPTVAVPEERVGFPYEFPVWDDENEWIINYVNGVSADCEDTSLEINGYNMLVTFGLVNQILSELEITSAQQTINPVDMVKEFILMEIGVGQQFYANYINDDNSGQLWYSAFYEEPGFTPTFIDFYNSFIVEEIDDRNYMSSLPEYNISELRMTIVSETEIEWVATTIRPVIGDNRGNNDVIRTCTLVANYWMALE